MEKHEAYIKALSAIGGDMEDEYSAYLTEEYEQAYDTWLKGQPKVSGVTLYRGYTFDKRFFEEGLWGEGEVVSQYALSAGFHPAFTLSPMRAAIYINDYGNAYDEFERVKVLFELHTSGKYMVDVSALSIYPQEDEHHCTEDAKFKVLSIKRTGGFTTIVMEEM